jgi:hypothetical protein
MYAAAYWWMSLRRDRTQPIVVGHMFDFDSFPEANFRVTFNFRKADIVRLKAILQLPDVLILDNRDKIEAKVGLCVFLKRLRSAGTLNDVAYMLNISATRVSRIFNFVLQIIYEFCHEDIKFSHVISIERMKIYSNCIQEKGSPLNGCWGFIDGTVRRICRPGQLQEGTYNGHKKYTALKYQGVCAPDGLIVSLAGPESGRTHDIQMLRVSGLLEALEDYDYEEHDGNLFIYGDAGYQDSRYLLTGFSGAALTAEQKQFNYSMSKVRECVEWSFAKVINLWKFVDFHKNQKSLQAPVGKQYIVAVYLTNCHTCLYGSQTSDYFKCTPPSIHEYVNKPNDEDYLFNFVFLLPKSTPTL